MHQIFATFLQNSPFGYCLRKKLSNLRVLTRNEWPIVPILGSSQRQAQARKLAVCSISQRFTGFHLEITCTGCLRIYKTIPNLSESDDISSKHITWLRIMECLTLTDFFSVKHEASFPGEVFYASLLQDALSEAGRIRLP